MSGSYCHKCGAEILSPSLLPRDSQLCSNCAAQASHSKVAAEYQLAPPETPQPRPSSPSPRRATPPSDTAEQSFFCMPLLAVLGVTAAGMMCLCPLSMFLDFPKGLLMLWGVGLVFGGIFWFGFRFKNLTGEGMQYEAPWYLRGGLATMLQLGGYVIQEPVIFGPPFSVMVLGLLLCISPIFIPDLRPYFRRNPGATVPAPPPVPPAATPAPSAPPVSVAAEQPSPAAPASKEPLPLREQFASGSSAYLTDLAEFDVQAGPCPIGKHGSLGNGSAIVVQGKERRKGLGMHPPNPPGIAKACYRIDQQRATLQGGVALNDTAESPFGAAVFTIRGDGKLLWQSQPVKARGQVTDFAVVIEGVDVLEMSVTAEGLAHYVHAVWVEPRLTKK
jgi:hypothetical protein